MKRTRLWYIRNAVFFFSSFSVKRELEGSGRDASLCKIPVQGIRECLSQRQVLKFHHYAGDNWKGESSVIETDLRKNAC